VGQDSQSGLVDVSPAREPFVIDGTVVRPGRRHQLELPISKLVTGTQIALPVLVVHGRSDGPTVWVNAAIHGDEINGVETIRRVLGHLDPRRMCGTVLAVPVVNVHGFIAGDRYLPDRRDLNRSFPGSARGSLASRIAHLLMSGVVARCSVGIDLHTGSGHRTNLPQVRADLTDPTARDLAHAFGPPIVIHAAIRDGSLRQAATDAGATVLVYEGGEAWRFDENAIRSGVDGILRVFIQLGIIEPETGQGPTLSPRPESWSSRWVRARRSGIAHIDVELGDQVERGQGLGRLHDSFGNRLGRFTSPIDGVIIGISLDPLFNQGDAMVHVASLDPGVRK
jgi:predicted deacylase